MTTGATVHASCVAVEGRGLLIFGPSGYGKSALAVQMIALGARLVADDQVALQVQDGQPIARSAPGLAGLVEIRGLGLVRLREMAQATIVLATDLALPGTSRLPKPYVTSITDVGVPLIPGADRPNLCFEAMALLRYGTPPFFLDPEAPIT